MQVSDPTMQSRQRSPRSPRPAVTAPSFTLFLQLPPELRNMVWTFAAQEKRIISITEDSRSFRDFSPDDPRYDRAYEDQVIVTHNATTPRIMHACRESRSIGLDFYKLRLGASFFDKPIFLNYELDALHFQNRSDFAAFYKHDYDLAKLTQHYHDFKELMSELKMLIVGSHRDCFLSLYMTDFWQVNIIYALDGRDYMNHFNRVPLDQKICDELTARLLDESKDGMIPTIRRLKSLKVEELDTIEPADEELNLGPEQSK